MQRQSAEWRLRVWRLAHALRRAIDTVICKENERCGDAELSTIRDATTRLTRDGKYRTLYRALDARRAFIFSESVEVVAGESQSERENIYATRRFHRASSKISQR